MTRWALPPLGPTIGYVSPNSPTIGYVTTTPKPGWKNIDIVGVLCALHW